MIVRQQRSVRLLSKKAFDVCVIGSGAAGIPFVRELAHSGLSILVLEAGDIDVSVSSQEFYKGEEDTQNMPPDYLSTMRLRALGGTTGHWTGEGLPLDDIDFAPREWIPHSGWPIGPSALAPYYKTAARYCGFPDDLGGDLALPPTESSAHRPLFGFRPLLTANPVPRFGTEYLKFLKSSRNVELCLSCPVIELHSDATQTKTASVVAVAGGERVTFTARNYVLAAGTVENARLLLNSLRLNRLTLGEEREVIGRFFMDHCEGIVGMLRTPDTSSITGLKSDVHPRLRYHYIPTLWLSAEAQRLMKVQNMAFVVQRYLLSTNTKYGPS